VDGVVFVLHGERFLLSSRERATLLRFTLDGALGRVRSKMRQAGDLGAEIVITDNDERVDILDSLEVVRR
jgi:hypothetical protein